MQNYYLIVLLNTDYKIVTKILVSRLIRVYTKAISLYQHTFVSRHRVKSDLFN